MADIRIQRKERSAMPWIVGVIALILVIAAIVYWGRNGEPEVAVLDPVEETARQAGEVAPFRTAGEPSGAEFYAWVRDSETGAMGGEHEYTREGIRRMADALADLVARDTAPEVQQQLQTLRAQATAIRESPVESTDHANQAKQAFTTAVQILETLRQRPHLQQANLEQPVAEARAAADAIQTDTPLLEQRANVHQFFERISDAIQRAEQYDLVR